MRKKPVARRSASPLWMMYAFLRRIELRHTKTTTLLASSPYLGRAGRVAGTREAPVPGETVIVVYQEPDDVLENEIRILALRDARRQWPNSFKGL